MNKNFLVYKVDYDLDHRVFLLGAAFCNHEGERHEGVIGNALGAILVVENAVTIKEPQEQGVHHIFARRYAR